MGWVQRGEVVGAISGGLGQTGWARVEWVGPGQEGQEGARLMDRAEWAGTDQEGRGKTGCGKAEWAGPFQEGWARMHGQRWNGRGHDMRGGTRQRDRT